MFLGAGFKSDKTLPASGAAVNNIDKQDLLVREELLGHTRPALCVASIGN